MTLKCDAVFEGGGVKGIGLVGAVAAIEKAGYEFVNLAGSSAGAIVSALLAVGYRSDEIKEELYRLDYKKLMQEDFIDKAGIPGKMLSVGMNFGIYNADYFENWLETLLRRKNKTRFRDIRTEFSDEKYTYKFNAIASDITDARMLVLPNDLTHFGYNPDEYSISKAVRMSMSIPLFYEPFKLKDIDGKEHIIVDGGLLSNYPIWLLDDNTKNPPWPTFGFKFDSIKTDNKKYSDTYKQTEPIKNVVDYIKSIVKTMLDAHDKMHISNSNGDFERTILISTELKNSTKRKYINTTDFDITQEECGELFSNGFFSAENFIRGWDFRDWAKKYRS